MSRLPTGFSNTDDDNEDEVLFDNFLDDDDVFPYVEAAREVGLDGAHSETITALLDKVNKPLKNKAMQFLAYHLNPERFDAQTFYTNLFLDSGAFALADGTWIGPALAQQLTSHWTALSEQEVSENAEAEAQEAAQPLALTPEMLEQLVTASWRATIRCSPASCCRTRSRSRPTTACISKTCRPLSARWQTTTA